MPQTAQQQGPDHQRRRQVLRPEIAPLTVVVMNQQRAVGLGILTVALIAASAAFVPGSAMASPRTTPAPGVTCDGLECDNTTNSAVTLHGQMRCGQNSTGTEYFTGVARANGVTHFPNPTCSDGR